jgi:hypothetical protein
VFKNNASRPHCVHPHGVFYAKDSERAAYEDGTTGKDEADDAVSPGNVHTYISSVPERTGPAHSDGETARKVQKSFRIEYETRNGQYVK